MLDIAKDLSYAPSIPQAAEGLLEVCMPWQQMRNAYM